MFRCVPFLLLLALPVQAQQLTPDLKLVPTNAAAFAHVKLGDVWKGDAVKDFRDILAAAGPKAFEHLDREFHPPLSSIDRITTVLLEIEERQPPMIVTILSFSAPYDSQRIVKDYFFDPKPKKAGGKEYWNDSPMNIAAYFADTRTLVVSNGSTLVRYLTRAPNQDGPLAPLLAAAAGKYPLTIGVIPQSIPLPDHVRADIPDELMILFKAKSLLVAADNSKAVRLTAQLNFSDAAGAKAGMEAVKGACKMVKTGPFWLEQRKEIEEQLFDTKGKRKLGPSDRRSLNDIAEAVQGFYGLAGFNWADRQLTDPPLKLQGETLMMDIALPAYVAPFFDLAIAGSSALQLLAQMEVIQSAIKLSMNNLKQIGIAIHSYDSAQGMLPASGTGMKNGKPLLSWRVAILPYLEQDNLYNSFKQDEPWDSDHNKKLIARMPKVYQDPRIPEADRKPGMTHYKVFTGKDAIFNPVQNWSVASLTSSARWSFNLIFVAAGGEPVIWTKPDDFAYDDNKAVPDLTKPFPELLVLMGDGSVRRVNPKMKDFEKKLRAAVNPNSTSASSLKD